MKPSIPKGTRDFSPQEMVKRNYIFDTIRSVFKLYGYLPIETPSMENLDTLMGKYGEEGDRLIFKILNSGDYLENAKDKDIKELGSKGLTKYISEKALRYDLTVPFARYVVQHQNDITFPFKRYQIQPVWRADRPQKGRYREFYQCDADVIGSPSLLNELELIKIINDVFKRLGVPVIIKINNRKVLQGIADGIEASDRMIDIAMAIDKLDKIGVGGVAMELEGKDFTKKQIETLWEMMRILGNSIELIDEKMESRIKFSKFSPSDKLGAGIMVSETLQEGLRELVHVASPSIMTESSGNNRIQFDISLARGLNYYTGTIMEVKVDQSKCSSEFASSICGGGRYDDLTGVFGLPNVSGVGISFGADRIYDVLEELNLFPKDVTSSTKVMFLNFGDGYISEYIKIADVLREAGVCVEIYPDSIKAERFDKDRKKQFTYAEKKKIPYVIILGERELSEFGQENIINLKIIGGETKKVKKADLIKHIV